MDATPVIIAPYIKKSCTEKAIRNGCRSSDFCFAFSFSTFANRPTPKQGSPGAGKSNFFNKHSFIQAKPKPRYLSTSQPAYQTNRFTSVFKRKASLFIFIALLRYYKQLNTRHRSGDLRQYSNKAKIVGISFAIFTQ